MEIQRESEAVVFERATQKTYEVVVGLTPKGSERVISCTHIPGVQPNLTANEYEEVLYLIINFFLIRTSAKLL